MINFENMGHLEVLWRLKLIDENQHIIKPDVLAQNIINLNSSQDVEEGLYTLQQESAHYATFFLNLKLELTWIREELDKYPKGSEDFIKQQYLFEKALRDISSYSTKAKLMKVMIQSIAIIQKKTDPTKIASLFSDKAREHLQNMEGLLTRANAALAQDTQDIKVLTEEIQKIIY